MLFLNLLYIYFDFKNYLHIFASYKAMTMEGYINKKYIAVCLLLGLFTVCSEDKNVPVAIPPVLSDIVIIDKTASTVTLAGEIMDSNGYPVTERGIFWGTSLPLDANAFHTPQTESENNTISVTLEELKSSTLYYFRLYALTQGGIGYSNIDSVNTDDGLGTAHTFILSDQIQATTALAGGVIEFPGEGSIRERGVYYATSASMANKDSVISIAERDSFVCNISNLHPSTNYYVQAYVKNTYGIFRGETLNFTTTSGKPVLHELFEIGVFSNSAQIVAYISSIGDAPLIRRGFCWNKKGNPTIADETIFVDIGPNSSYGFYAADITPLESNQLYHVRAFAENSFGITYTSSQSFITSNDIPTF